MVKHIKKFEDNIPKMKLKNFDDINKKISAKRLKAYNSFVEERMVYKEVNK